MTNDSSTGGFLAPLPSPAPTPLEDAALQNFLQSIVVGITGLTGAMVFPRWQETPPNIPPINTAWASIGVQNRKAETFAFEFHDGTLNSGNGLDTLIRHEEAEILCGFYGPTADTNASLLRDGLQVAQNREALQLAGMSLIECGDLLTVPSLVNSQWYYRVDLPFRVRRAIVREYPILNLLSSQITVKTSDGLTEVINVIPPA
jgi:hypothetical protein